MKVTIAIDSLKGSLSSLEAGRAIEEGIKHVYADADVTVRPLADGGEGTVEALLFATGGQEIHTPAADPLGRLRTASFGLLSDGSAVLEMAAASGLTLLTPEERDPGSRPPTEPAS